MATQKATQAPPQAPPQGVNLFGGLKDKKVSDRGTFLNEGVYTVRATKCVMMEKVRSTGAPAFILEFDILKSSRPEHISREANETAEEYEARLKRAPNAVGTKASWFQNLKDIDVGYSALKGFAANVLGESPDDREFIEGVEDFLNEVVKGERDEDGNFTANAPSAIAGWVLPVEVKIIETKKGNDFSLYTWGKRVEEAS